MRNWGRGHKPHRTDFHLRISTVVFFITVIKYSITVTGGEDLFWLTVLGNAVYHGGKVWQPDAWLLVTLQTLSRSKEGEWWGFPSFSLGSEAQPTLWCYLPLQCVFFH